MEILTMIKTPANFNSKDFLLSVKANEEILENPKFMQLQKDHQFGAYAADNSDFCDFDLENSNGFIKVIF